MAKTKGNDVEMKGRARMSSEMVEVANAELEHVNASGHPDKLQRNHSFLSICGLALIIDNAWTAMGGSISIALGRPRTVRIRGAQLQECFC